MVLLKSNIVGVLIRVIIENPIKLYDYIDYKIIVKVEPWPEGTSDICGRV